MAVAIARKLGDLDFDNVWDEFLDRLSEGLESDVDDVISFVERELKVTLYPRQRLVLKVFYGVPMTPDEKEDFERMLDGGDVYCRAWETGAPYQHLILICGRRGSKTTVSSAIQCYELYTLLMQPSPQVKYRLLPKQRISFVNCAAAQDQAQIFFDDFREFSAASDYLSDNLTHATNNKLDYRKKLRAECLHSNSRTQRGRTAKIIIYDELAHFIDTAGPNSDDKVFKALQPSIKTFLRDGKSVIATSPGIADGVAYTQYEKVLKGDLKHALCFQLASWEMNPNFTQNDFAEEFAVDPAYAEMEYGAQFGFAEGKYLPFIAVERCFDSTRTIPTLEEIVQTRSLYTEDELKAVQNRIYYAHCDPGLTSNRLTFAVVHYDEGDVYLDYGFAIDPPPHGEIDLDDAERRIVDANVVFKFRKVTFDQWNSALLSQRLRKKHGVRSEIYDFTALSNMDMYSCLRGYIVKGKFHSPECALARAELQALVRTTKAKGFSVAAPDKGPVRTDDFADSIAAATRQATLHVGDTARSFIRV